MTFHETKTDENFPLLRKVSESGKWELGLVPMLFGVRVRLGKVGNPWCEAELGSIFPRQRIKPMSLDKECYSALLALGKTLSQKAA